MCCGASRLKHCRSMRAFSQSEPRSSMPALPHRSTRCRRCLRHRLRRRCLPWRRQTCLHPPAIACKPSLPGWTLRLPDPAARRGAFDCFGVRRSSRRHPRWRGGYRGGDASAGRRRFNRAHRRTFPYERRQPTVLGDPVERRKRPGKDSAATDTDGVLEVREIMNLEMHGRLAILSDGASAAMRAPLGGGGRPLGLARGGHSGDRVAAMGD